MEEILFRMKEVLTEKGIKQIWLAKKFQCSQSLCL